MEIDTGAINIFLTEIVDSVWYVKLAPTQLPIGKIEKLKKAGNKIIVLDSKVSKALFVFNINGEFLYRINGERQQQITDFCTDSSQTCLYIYYANKHVLSRYSLDSGKIQNTARISGYFHCMEMLGDNVIVLGRDGIAKLDGDPQKYNKSRICLFDEHGKYLKGYLRTPIFPYINYGKMYLEGNGDGSSISITRLYSDTVYALTRQGLEAKYKLGLALQSDFYDFYNSQSTQEADQFARTDKFAGIWGPFFRTNVNIAFYFAYRNKVYLYWNSFKDNKHYSISYFINDLDRTPDIGMVKYLDNKEMISVLQPLDILNANTAAMMTKSIQKSPKLSELALGLTDRSNPVLAIYKLKETTQEILANK
ncbi:hypothetical protein J2T02_003961 [Chitinophaga terrae (ex Kim and Jung 2007)]|uniref:6-bladed beta-propeller n=1 Tax=Chitinophaga terrae (ex Kim and Jung 2007) TaxID=408074 RepID=UPI00277E2700|nr:6-bladed beta-propeller [Chitinophaga terrae (ex Kim and Jung 2007)]MDQ0108821.1 hypothetical protein [Chitinophaga terrae (ex Kim and Jung 2007)]